MGAEEDTREKINLERILTLKQMLKDGQGGPAELHELGVRYHGLRNYESAVHYLDELLDAYPEYVELAAVHALRIFCLVEHGEHERAEELLAERLKIHERDTRLLAMRAFVREKADDFAEAIRLHRRVLELEPENLNSLNSLGYLLALHGAPEEQQEAYDCLKKVISRSPDHPAYLDSFGVFLAKKGQKEHARKALMKALKRAPNNTEILQHLKELLGV